MLFRVPWELLSFSNDDWYSLETLITTGADNLAQMGKQWIDSVIQRIGLPLCRILCSRSASFFELAIQNFYSPAVFSHCFDLGLPLSIMGKHSALTSFACGYYPFIRRDAFKMFHKQEFDFIKGFFHKHAEKIDLSATIWRLYCNELDWAIGRDEFYHGFDHDEPDMFPVAASKCNLLQASVLTGCKDLFEVVLRSAESQGLRLQDLICVNTSHFMSMVASAKDALDTATSKGLRFFVEHPDVAGNKHVMLNQPSEAGLYPLEYAIRYRPGLAEDLISLGADPLLVKASLQDFLKRRGVATSGAIPPYHNSFFLRLWDQISDSGGSS
jgi:hypothetical protein